MIQHNIDELIIIYFSGELTPAENKELADWINASPENRQYLMHMREVWFSSISASNHGSFNKDAAFMRFVKRVGQESKRRFLTRWRPVINIAAAVVLVITATCVAYRLGVNKVKDQLMSVVVEAPTGSRTKLYLPDSTLVWLNAGSRIVYSQGFGISDRKVCLCGEGYFEVKKNERLPMQVISNGMAVEVLGTTFNFRDYADEEEAVVSLEEGKIISWDRLNADQKFCLTPNQKVTLNKKTKRILLSDVIAENMSGWVDGRLFFDEMLLPDIVRTLKRSYGVQIRIADESLKDFRFYGQFSRTENTIGEVLDRIEATGRIKYLIGEEEIILISGSSM